MSLFGEPSRVEGLEAFHAFVSSGRAPIDMMRVPEVDGFLTAVAIGPELVMPREWLPIIWGDEPAFDSAVEAQAVMGEVLAHYNNILSAVAENRVVPILEIDTDGMPLPIGWAEAFMEGVGLRAKAWQPLFDSESGGALLIPIVALCSDEEGDPLLDVPPEKEDEFLDDAPGLLPRCVIGIAEFWKRRGQGPRPSTGRKPGRNETWARSAVPQRTVFSCGRCVQ